MKGNLNNHIKQTNWTVLTGTQDICSSSVSISPGWNRRLWRLLCLAALQLSNST